MGRLPGKGLPAAYCDIYEDWIDFDTVANAPGRLSRNQGRAATQERLIDRLARIAVVQDWPAHALNRLLRGVLGLDILSAGRNAPERRLFAITGPIALFADGVPTRLVLPVVVALTHDQPFFGPSNLSPNCEAAVGEAVGDDCCP